VSWSPARPISDADFERTAASFDNRTSSMLSSTPIGTASGWHLALKSMRGMSFLAGLPTVDVPAIVLDSTEDPATRPRERHAVRFPRLLAYRQISSGHNQPFDAPAEVALAVRDPRAFLQSAAKCR
jgi:hypothetical protein